MSKIVQFSVPTLVRYKPVWSHQSPIPLGHYGVCGFNTQVLSEEPLDLCFRLRRGLRVPPTRMSIIGAEGGETIKPMVGPWIHF